MKSGERNLAIDVYTPPNAKANEKLPAVIFLNAIGDNPGSEVKEWEIYKSFPRLIAAHGMIGISMNADGNNIQETLKGLFDFLEKTVRNTALIQHVSEFMRLRQTRHNRSFF